MYLASLRVRNFRRFADSGDITLGRLQALIGENNAGKSSLLAAIDCLTSAGAGGISEKDFRDSSCAIVINGTFKDLTPQERSVWKSYLINGELRLEKRLWIECDERSGKRTLKAEFHGYRAEPQVWYLSLPKIEKHYGGKTPRWADLVQEYGLPEYFYSDQNEKKCTKTSYINGLSRYISENAVEFDPPDVSTTQALGLQSRVIASLPAVFLLPAITDYSSEIDKRTTSTTFRRLMAELSDRILQTDPHYQEVLGSFQRIRDLLNGSSDGTVQRVASLGAVEARITELLKELMPSVGRVSLSVTTDTPREVFARGVELLVDDGTETEVLAKGHGLQRCIVFTLLRALILSQRDALVPDVSAGSTPTSASLPNERRSIILLVEEPELYIHPQLCKLFYDTMVDFSSTDQVIYTTHSPLFVDAGEYESIAIVRPDHSDHTSIVANCDLNAFAGLTDKKIFQGFTRLNTAVNELFFAKHVLLVEGPEDRIAVLASCRADGKIRRRLEELDVTVIEAGGKTSIPFFQRVLNAFRIPYAVLHDSDIMSGTTTDDGNTTLKLNAEIANLASGRGIVTFPHKLETSLKLDGHFKDQYSAHDFLANPENIPQNVRIIVGSAIEEARKPWAEVASNSVPTPQGVPHDTSS